MTIPIPSGEIPSHNYPETDLYDREMEIRRRWWRWHFAGQAMQGLLAAESAENGTFSPDKLAVAARARADALIAELEKEGER